MMQRERVIKAIEHRTTNIVPHQLDLTQGLFERLCHYFGSSEFLYTVADNHLIREKNKNHKVLDKNSYIDIFGVVWNTDHNGGDIGVIKDYTFKDPIISSYKFPEPSYELVKLKCEILIKDHNNLFKIYEIGLSFFERAWSLRGMAPLLMDMILEEKFVNELLDKILEYNLGVIELAASYPIDCILLGDDWGQQKGLIMGYPLWRKLIKPRIAIMYESIKKHNLYVAQHSCGDNYELFGDLIEMGLDIYNTFQPEIYDIEKFKREFGDFITIYGGISTQGILTRGAPDQVYDETNRTIEIMNRHGGFIAAPTHQITIDVSNENIVAFIKAVKGE